MTLLKSYLKSNVKNASKLEVLLKIYDDVDANIKVALNQKLEQLTNEDKSLVANTLNQLSLQKDPQTATEKKEQKDLFILINMFFDLLLKANPFQKDSLKEILPNLNGKQQLAAILKDGPLLLSAGPGSGKTRTLTFKIATLINVHGVNPANILAVTFTNKAADEMKSRVEALCGVKAKGLNMGTFHSICSKFLRQNIEVLKTSYNRNFTIITDTDSLIKELLEEMGYDKKLYREVKKFISDCKNELKTPASLKNHHEVLPYLDVYEKYQNKLRISNLLDFDDLILLSVYILQSYPDIREKYQDIYKYIHIDEYQDTNLAQYQLAKLLADKYKNVTVVGDEDQSIYKFRGADITNMLNFTKDYPEAIGITLDTNYRSTKNIVNASSELIKLNKERLDKIIQPFEEKEDGDLIEVHKFFDDKHESSFVANKIKDLANEQGYGYNSFMVLFRTNNLSRSVEESFIRAGIPYKIVGGTNFYDRAEIQDLVAYLKLSVNLQDSLSLKRIYGVPARRISPTVYSIIEEFADTYGMSSFQAALQINKINNAHYKGQNVPEQYQKYVLKQAQFVAVNKFLILIRKFYEKAKTSTAYETLKYIIEEIDYKAYIRHTNQKDLTKQLDKLSNIDELLNASIDYVKAYEVEQDTPLEFINFVSLIKDRESDELQFNKINTLNGSSLDIKEEEEDIIFFGQYDVQLPATYEFSLSRSLVKQLVPMMKNLMKQDLNDEVVEEHLSNVALFRDKDKVIFRYDSFTFELSYDQMKNIITYLDRVTDNQFVRLMTMHSAKGLETNVVFIIGSEQGISPHFLNIETNLEEERRLFYVAMTRAEELLYISHCQQRIINGQYQSSHLSQFVKEVPEMYLHFIEH